MSEVRTFFRYCPACGKRFHIRLVNKKLVRDTRETRVQRMTPSNARVMVGSRSQPILLTVLEVDVPVTVDVEDFEYSYLCGQCGHTWTETRTREEEEEVKK